MTRSGQELTNPNRMTSDRKTPRHYEFQIPETSKLTAQPNLVRLTRALTIQASNICRIGARFTQTQK
jgi:hypothetical protein